jgi:hypothetical protein
MSVLHLGALAVLTALRSRDHIKGLLPLSCLPSHCSCVLMLTSAVAVTTACNTLMVICWGHIYNSQYRILLSQPLLISTKNLCISSLHSYIKEVLAFWNNHHTRQLISYWLFHTYTQQNCMSKVFD